MKEIEDYINKNKQEKNISQQDGYAYYLEEDDVNGLIEIYNKKIDETIIELNNLKKLAFIDWGDINDIIRKLEKLK